MAGQTAPSLIGNRTQVRLTKPAGATTLIGSGYEDTLVYAGDVTFTDTTATTNVQGGTITYSGNLDQTDAHGAGAGFIETTEVVTLSTSSTLTTSATNLLPANSLILAVTAIPTVNLAGTTGFQLGDPTSNTRFTASSSTNVLTTSAATVGNSQWNPAVATTLALSGIQAAATTVVVKANILATGGALRITVLSIPTTGPTS